jgi:5,10-methylenetetrahydromethanopterin reductase
MSVAPRFGLCLLPEHIGDCAPLARQAEASGFEMLGFVDSQNIACDVHVALTTAALATRTIRLGPTVTNPLTRHVVVTANAMTSIDELSGGRAFVGLGSADSAAFTLAMRPARLAVMEQSVLDLQTLSGGGVVERDGRRLWVKTARRRLPVYLAADGPRMRQLAGRIADGALLASGISPDEVARCLDDVASGAKAGGRRLEDLDLWWLVKANVADTRQRAVDEIKMALAASANRAFRFVNDGVPAHLAAAIAELKRRYDPHRHESLAADGNGRLLEQPDLTDFLAKRFAFAGTPDDCAAQVQRAVAAGATQFLLTGITPDPRRFVERWATEVTRR